MNWLKLVIGICGIGSLVAALLYYLFIACSATQEQVEEEGNVYFGIEIQALVDDFKEQFGRYPTPDELTNLLVMTIYVQSLTLTSNLDNSGQWYYNEKSGEVRINSRRTYYVGLASRINLFNTYFRRPTKVDATHFGKIETLDYTWANDRVNLEKPQINQVITNLYTTNRWR